MIKLALLFGLACLTISSSGPGSDREVQRTSELQRIRNKRASTDTQVKDGETTDETQNTKVSQHMDHHCSIEDKISLNVQESTIFLKTVDFAQASILVWNSLLHLARNTMYKVEDRDLLMASGDSSAVTCAEAHVTFRTQDLVDIDIHKNDNYYLTDIIVIKISERIHGFIPGALPQSQSDLIIAITGLCESMYLSCEDKWLEQLEEGINFIFINRHGISVRMPDFFYCQLKDLPQILSTTTIKNEIQSMILLFQQLDIMIGAKMQEYIRTQFKKCTNDIIDDIEKNKWPSIECLEKVKPTINEIFDQVTARSRHTRAAIIEIDAKSLSAEQLQLINTNFHNLRTAQSEIFREVKTLKTAIKLADRITNVTEKDLELLRSNFIYTKLSNRLTRVFQHTEAINSQMFTILTTELHKLNYQLQQFLNSIARTSQASSENMYCNLNGCFTQSKNFLLKHKGYIRQMSLGKKLRSAGKKFISCSANHNGDVLIFNYHSIKSINNTGFKLESDHWLSRKCIENSGDCPEKYLSKVKRENLLNENILFSFHEQNIFVQCLYVDTIMTMRNGEEFRCSFKKEKIMLPLTIKNTGEVIENKAFIQHLIDAPHLSKRDRELTDNQRMLY